MKLSVKSLAPAAGILWALAVFFVGFLNFLWPSYGKAFLDVMSSVYPGYKVTGSLGSAIVGALYALLDGLVSGALFAWFYNCFASGS